MACYRHRHPCGGGWNNFDSAAVTISVLYEGEINGFDPG
jgi:hypothetical protein